MSDAERTLVISLPKAWKFRSNACFFFWGGGVRAGGGLVFFLAFYSILFF